MRRGAEGRRVRRVAGSGVGIGQARAGALGGAATSATTIFTGFGIGLVYKALNVAFKGWKDVPQKIFGAPFEAGSISAEISPELLGVGYIIGPRIGSIMCAGGVLAYLVLIPAIKFFGSGLTQPLAPGTMPDPRHVARRHPRARTSSTSAPAPWRPAASSAWCARCRPSGAACVEGLTDFRRGAAEPAVARPRPSRICR